MATLLRAGDSPGNRVATRRALSSQTAPQLIPSSQPPTDPPTQGGQTQRRQETLTDLIDTIRKALSAVESSPDFPATHSENFATIRVTLEKIQDTERATTPSATQGFKTLLNELKTIKKDLQDTKHNVSEIQKAAQTPSISSGARTWASVASLPYTMQPTMSVKPTPPIPSVTLKVTDPKLNTDLKALTPPDLLKTLKERGLAEAIAARSLPSGDLKITLSNPIDKKRLEDTREWDQCFPGQMKTVTPTFAVEVVSVRINELGRTQEELKAATTRLLEENKHIPGLRIDGIHWMRRIQPNSIKTHASLILKIPQLGISDTLRARGMVIGSIIHDVRPYDSKCRVTQCFKCQRFGHTTRACSSPPKCGHCAEDHDTRDCQNNTQAKCTNCGQKHKAWDRTCRMYREKLEKARTHRLLLPHERSPGGTIIEPYEIPPITGKRPAAPQGEMGEQPRRRPGRPRKIDQPNPASQTQLRLTRLTAEPNSIESPEELDALMSTAE